MARWCKCMHHQTTHQVLGKYKTSQSCQRKRPLARLSSAADAVGAGTRAGLHGQTLVSTGHADLDRVLGGGLPLGALLVVMEDAASPHADMLLRCFAAEGVACGHQARSKVDSGVGERPLQLLRCSCTWLCCSMAGPNGCSRQSSD